MSAGSGIQHSEFNPSPTAAVHFLQIWIQPNTRGIEPSYEEKRFSPQEKRGRLRLIVSPDGADGSLLIHQDARIYAGCFNGSEQARLQVEAGRCIYIHVARGGLAANEVLLEAGDALKITDSPRLSIERGRDAEVLVFDLPGEAASR
jgi:redox-sensitive bicupin YhaK (pirin superfamily)